VHAALSQWSLALSDAERAGAIRPIWLPAALATAEALEALERWAAAAAAYDKVKARWVTLRARLGDAKSSLGDAKSG
jgi:hypothetical protein